MRRKPGWNVSHTYTVYILSSKPDDDARMNGTLGAYATYRTKRKGAVVFQVFYLSGPGQRVIVQFVGTPRFPKEFISAVYETERYEMET